MSEIDPIVKAAVDAWLAEVENYGIRAERMPEGALPWLYEAAMVGIEAVRAAEAHRLSVASMEALERDFFANGRRIATAIIKAKT